MFEWVNKWINLGKKERMNIELPNERVNEWNIELIN